MKINIKSSVKLFLFFLGVLLSNTSCSYQDIADAEYPDQLIYMPAAKSGIYLIDKVAEPIGNTTPGNAYRYLIDMDRKKFIVPLSVYRSGIDNKGGFSVDIQANADTITRLQLIAGKLPDSTRLLPSEVYTLVPSVEIKDGEEIAKFDLSIDIDFLNQNHGKIYALGIQVSSPSRKSNKGLATTILVINTSYLKPVIEFTLTPDINDGKTVKFTNLTLYGQNFTWDFGDGSPTSNETSPTHMYSNYGSYNVTLTSKGLIGNNFVTKTIKLWENITTTYFPNPGNPFLRSDNRTVKTGNLKDWSCTANVQPGGYGGFYNDNGVGIMDFFSVSGLTNAKIYRTIDLPAGTYKTGFKNAGFIGVNNCYFAVVLGNQLPNTDQIESDINVLAYYHWNTNISSSTNEVYFTLASAQTVTIGFVVTNAAKSEIKINSVFLFK